MIRLFATTLLALHASSSFAAGFPSDISKHCGSAVEGLANAALKPTVSEAGSVFEFQIPLRTVPGLNLSASHIDASLSCAKPSKDPKMGDSLYLSVEYDAVSVRQHPAMRSAANPEEAAIESMSQALALTLPQSKNDARKFLTSCLHDASTRPTQQMVNRSIDEKTFFTTTKDGVTYECTRRVKPATGTSIFLFRIDLKQSHQLQGAH